MRLAAQQITPQKQPRVSIFPTLVYRSYHNPIKELQCGPSIEKEDNGQK